MKLLEYEAKQILSRFGIPIPDGSVDNHDTIALPRVLKSQVPVGGRGKAGGIKIVTTPQEYSRAHQEIEQTAIKGHLPNAIYAEEAIDTHREFYISLTIDRAHSEIRLLAHDKGGVEIESVDPDHFFSKKVTRVLVESIGESLAELYDIPQKTFFLQEFVANLLTCFIDNDCTLLEINPLILDRSGQIIAGDCKIIVDDAALFRHPEWDFEATPADANFVTLNKQGTVATVANGAGLAMATVDAVAAAGLTPANFLDVGGNASTESVIAAFRKITELPQVTAIVINIFGGIVRCDDIANAVIDAKNEFDQLPKLYIRLSGNRAKEAKDILENAHIPLYPDLASCLREVSP